MGDTADRIENGGLVPMWLSNQVEAKGRHSRLSSDHPVLASACTCVGTETHKED